MPSSYDVDITEVEYLRHSDAAFMARIFMPRGPGPFPAVVEAHGGAWCEGNRANNDPINKEVAKGGVVIAALEFRNPPAATYPGSVADVNYAVRWLKSEAARFNTRPEMVGSMGTSSGGHLVVLNGLKPLDPRYTAVAAKDARFDARVPYVVALWPVICPLGRYLDRKAKAPDAQNFQSRGGAVAMQQKYWLTEDAMGEGSPNLALERGDAVEMPHILYLQNPIDELHPRQFVEQFVGNYRKRGGDVALEWFEGAAYDLIRSQPASDAAKASVQKIIAFIHRETA